MRFQQGHAGALVGAAGVQHLQNAAVAHLKAQPRKGQRLFGQRRCLAGGGEGGGIGVQPREQIADLREGAQHRLAVGGGGGAGLGLGPALGRAQGATVEDGRRNPAEQIETPEVWREQLRGDVGSLLHRRPQRDVGIEIGLRHADAGHCRMQPRLCREDVGPLVHQGAGQGHRHRGGQGELAERIVRCAQFRRGNPQQRGEQVAVFGQILLEGGQGALVRRQLGLSAQHLDLRAAAGLLAGTGEGEVAAAFPDQGALRGDGVADGGDGEIFADHAAGEGEVSGLGLVGLCRALGPGLFQCAAVAAPQIGIEADAATDAVEVDLGVGDAGKGCGVEAEGGEIDFLMLGAGVGIQLRQAGAGHGHGAGIGAGQRGVAGGKAGIVGQRPGDQRVQIRRAEGLPPAGGGALALIGAEIGGGGGIGRCGSRSGGGGLGIAFSPLRTRRGVEIWPHGAG